MHAAQQQLVTEPCECKQSGGVHRLAQTRLKPELVLLLLLQCCCCCCYFHGFPCLATVLQTRPYQLPINRNHKSPEVPTLGVWAGGCRGMNIERKAEKKTKGGKLVIPFSLLVIPTHTTRLIIFIPLQFHLKQHTGY